MPRPHLPHKLHIALIARSFPIWGTTSGVHFLRLIARGLAKSGHQVSVICADDHMQSQSLQNEGIHFHILPPATRRQNLMNDRFANFVGQKIGEIHIKNELHLVHSLDRCVIPMSQQGRRLKIAFSYDVSVLHLSELFAVLAATEETVRSQIQNGLLLIYQFLRTYYGGDNTLLNYADGLFVANPRERVALERYYRYPDLRMHTIPYGIEVGDLKPREDSNLLRKKWNIPEDASVIMTMSDMNDVSDLIGLLDSFEKVVIKKPNSRFIIAGSGPKLKDVEYHALSLALGNKVIFPGQLETQDIQDLITLSQIFFSLGYRSSGYEPSVLEAMAQRKIIIGSELGPISTIVENGVNGFLVRPADQKELARLMMEIFSNQLPITTIGESAREKVLALFNPQKMVQETTDAYYSILRRTGFYRAKFSNP